MQFYSRVAVFLITLVAVAPLIGCSRTHPMASPLMASSPMTPPVTMATPPPLAAPIVLAAPSTNTTQGQSEQLHLCDADGDPCSTEASGCHNRGEYINGVLWPPPGGAFGPSYRQPEIFHEEAMAQLKEIDELRWQIGTRWFSIQQVMNECRDDPPTWSSLRQQQRELEAQDVVLKNKKQQILNR